MSTGGKCFAHLERLTADRFYFGVYIGQMRQFYLNGKKMTVQSFDKTD